MTRVEIVDGQLKIEVLGWHKMWACKSRLSFPLEDVVGTGMWDREKHRLGWYALRAPGTYVPWVILAGTYHKWGRRYFYDVCDFSRAIVIELRNQMYERVVVEVEDPEAVLAMMGADTAPMPELVA